MVWGRDKRDSSQYWKGHPTWKVHVCGNFQQWCQNNPPYTWTEMSSMGLMTEGSPTLIHLPQWLLYVFCLILLRTEAILCFSGAPSGHIASELGQGQGFDLRRGPFLWLVSNPFSLPYCFVLHILSCLAHLVMMFEGCIIISHQLCCLKKASCKQELSCS